MLSSGEGSDITRFVFLPTDSINAPTYKVIIRSIALYSARDEELWRADAEGVDGEYSANILRRGYNCISVDAALPMEKARELVLSAEKIVLGLDIISVFNVCMSMTYNIHIDSEKSVEGNPDVNAIPDLSTFIIHHSNYVIEEKSILKQEK